MPKPKRDTVSSLIAEEYRKLKENCGFIQMVSFAGETCMWTDEFLHDMKLTKKKSSKFFITDISAISNKELPFYSTSLKFKDESENKKKKTNQPMIFADKTGLFKIDFNDGSVMIFAKWFSGGGKGVIIESMFASEVETWKKWTRLFESQKKKKATPKIGIFRIHMTQYGIMYEALKKIPNNPIYHEELDKIRNSVNYYFSNVPSFMKYNQPGRRSLLLYGEQGTSKTSTLYKLALEHEKTKSIVFSTDIQALAAHIQMCEKYNVPTLAFFEDAEGVFSQNNSSIKNFLSGIDARQNRGGTCIVYTTNYPERIEQTIIERPERIDELHYIGPIDGEMLVKCAKFYFGEHLPADVDLSRVLSKPMTGAEVKLMVENTLRYCASNRLEVSEETINNVVNNYIADLKKLKKFIDVAKKTLADRAKEKPRMGFGEEESVDIFGNNGNGNGW